ncbi:MAG: hypothetical protein QXS02_06145 [Candidatus Thermoplasmatota archaeon]
MDKTSYRSMLLFMCILFSSVFYSSSGICCKDIIVCGDASAGDYNLLLKVRDPSRPGLQVLTMVPCGYEYNFTHPWSGAVMTFRVNHSYIGVATVGDTSPNIFKAGMLFTDAGLAYGDADTMSNWVNPSRFAWDDFDWLRYSAEKASDIDEAVKLLTVDVVDGMHAPGVSENLFVVSGDKGVVVEADAYRYHVHSFSDGVWVMSNYPVNLWSTQVYKCLSIASSYDSFVDRVVRSGGIISLGGLFGVKVIRVTPSFIMVRQLPFVKYNERFIFMGTPVVIPRGEHRRVGDFDVWFVDYVSTGAFVRVRTSVKAWEDEIVGRLNERYGSLSVVDLMNLSRLHSTDLSYLRGMCEDRFIYECAMIYQIPRVNADLFSMGWFSANHACSSIYVPVHIVDSDIYTPYTTGEAANLSLSLLSCYGHGVLTDVFSQVEQVFIRENNVLEDLAVGYINQPEILVSLFTISDTCIQRQAFLTECFYLNYAKKLLSFNVSDSSLSLPRLWGVDYYTSLDKMCGVLSSLGDNMSFGDLKGVIVDIALSIGLSRVLLSHIVDHDPVLDELYIQAEYALRTGNIYAGFNLLKMIVERTSWV